MSGVQRVHIPIIPGEKIHGIVWMAFVHKAELGQKAEYGGFGITIIRKTLAPFIKYPDKELRSIRKITYEDCCLPIAYIITMLIHKLKAFIFCFDESDTPVDFFKEGKSILIFLRRDFFLPDTFLLRILFRIFPIFFRNRFFGEGRVCFSYNP